jgi:2,5-furandicarboxylate decarboxylase 1
MFAAMAILLCVLSFGGTVSANQQIAVADRLADFSKTIKYLEESGYLVRIKSEVDPAYELAGIAKQYEGKKKCVLFEKVKGSDYPVLIGLLWNREIIGEIFGVSKEQVPFTVGKAIGDWKKDKQAMVSPVLDQGPANEVIEKEVDLNKLPVPIHAMKDGGKYFDSSVVLVRDPETGEVNHSIHRLLITDKDRLTFLIDPGRHLGEYLEKMEAKNQPLEVTINNGVGLAVWLSSAIPKQGGGKYKIASHLIGSPIRLLKAQTVNVPALADAQFVIEAEILPNIREDEGPFAEVTGYYATQAKRWVMRVKSITHRKEPIYHTLLSGQEVHNAVGFTAEAKIYTTVKKEVPQLKAVYLDPGGCGFYGAVVQLEKDSPDVGRKAIIETFKAFPPLQRVVAVDSDVNLYDPIDVNWALATRLDVDNDLIILKNQSGHILNPIVKENPDGKGGTVTKIGMDATAPYPKNEKFERVKFMDVNLEKYVIEQ